MLAIAAAALIVLAANAEAANLKHIIYGGSESYNHENQDSHEPSYEDEYSRDHEHYKSYHLGSSYESPYAAHVYGFKPTYKNHYADQGYVRLRRDTAAMSKTKVDQDTLKKMINILNLVTNDLLKPKKSGNDKKDDKDETYKKDKKSYKEKKGGKDKKEKKKKMNKDMDKKDDDDDDYEENYDEDVYEERGNMKMDGKMGKGGNSFSYSYSDDEYGLDASSKESGYTY